MQWHAGPLAGGTALAVGALAILLGLCEVVVRALDGYSLTSVTLPAFSPSAATPPAFPPLADLAGTFRGAADIDPQWIDEPPTTTPGLVDPEFLERRARFRHSEVPESNLYNVWNARWVEEFGCTTTGPMPRILPLLPMPLQIFDPVEPSPRPTYRYYPGRTTPQGLTINRLGFRGTDLPLDKPPGTVRIAFVGASTTLGYGGHPYSYPDCRLHWLNRWAERAGLAVRFDGINGGRAGLSSTDIAAIVRQEVVPLEPDLTVYYEGANQFVYFAPQLVDAAPTWSRWAKSAPPAIWDRMVEGTSVRWRSS